MAESVVTHEGEGNEATRRDFIHIAAGAAAVGAGVMVAWPLVNQMNPSADVQALASIQVDVSGVAAGSQITVLFLGKPVFIRRRTPEEIEAGRAVPLTDLMDQNAQNANDPSLVATDENRTLDEAGEWLVQIGVCTHLGCVPLGQKSTDAKGDYNGWFCPCHGSHYDTSARIRKGPAPSNLLVPDYTFTSDRAIRIG